MFFENELAILVTLGFPKKNQGVPFLGARCCFFSPAVIVSLQTVFFLLAYTLQRGDVWR